jgi:RimJ/RimL family protein N-acetyltransferase
MFIAEEVLDPCLVPIGVVGLCHHDISNRRAEISFYIGDETARGQGHARRALILLHNYGFGELNLHRIWAEAYDFNEPSIGLLKSLGYQQEGVLRQHIWYNGWHDSIVLGLLAGDWYGR